MPTKVIYHDKYIKVSLNDDKLTELMRKSPKKADRAVRRTAFAISTDAKIFAPVDTGALRNSIHVVTSMGSEAEMALDMANSLRPGSVGGMAPSLAGNELGRAFIGVGVEYGIYVEFGTKNTGSQPFLIPAVEQNEQTLIDNVKAEFATL